MNSNKFQQSGKAETFVIALIIFTLTLLSNFSKELFVEQSGEFEIFGNLGFLLVIGLLLKWRYIRKIVSTLTVLAIFGILMGTLVAKSFTPSYIVLLVGLSIVFYLSSFSNSVKSYLEQT